MNFIQAFRHQTIRHNNSQGRPEKKRTIEIFFDIETFQYNNIVLEENPEINKTATKNKTFVVGVGIWHEDKFYQNTYQSFKTLFQTLKRNFKGEEEFCYHDIRLIAHNAEGFDNLNLYKELQEYFTFNYVYTKYNHKASEQANEGAMKKEEFLVIEENAMLEQRVGSTHKVMLNITFPPFKDIQTIDSLPKLSMSIAELGKKLLELGIINESQLKGTEFDYKAYNRRHDMTLAEAEEWAVMAYKDLNKDQLKYVNNDVLILGYARKFYNRLFPKHFRWGDDRLTMNIMRDYIYDDGQLNEMALYQIRKDYKSEFALTKTGKEGIVSLDYDRYAFAGHNLNDYLRDFFRGGYNGYNDTLINKPLNGCFYIDINSSFSNAMLNELIPTYISDAEDFEGELTEIELDLDNPQEYAMIRTDIDTMNDFIQRVESIQMTKVFCQYIKRMSTQDVCIDTKVLKLISNFSYEPITKIKCTSYIKFECVPFGASHVIHNTMVDKVEQKMREQNGEYVSSMDKYITKLMLNSIYGMAGLRSHFTTYTRQWDEGVSKLVAFQGIEGQRNSQRNIVFASFIASCGFKNLFEPLVGLHYDTVDDCFVYADTDSLHLKNEVYDFVKAKGIIDEDKTGALGLWKIEAEDVKMFVLNKKQYVYEYTDKETGEVKLVLKCGGVSHKYFDTTLSFEDFITYEFYHGRNIKVELSTPNNSGTISFYETTQRLQVGSASHISLFDTTEEVEEMLRRARADQSIAMADNLVYISTPYGDISQNDLYKKRMPVTGKENSIYDLISFDYMQQNRLQ